MGCDIHAWVEKEVDGKWVAVEELTSGYMDSRCYNWFGHLAGVRSSTYQKHSPARSVDSSELSDTCKVLYEHYDCHSLHVIPYTDLLETRKRYLQKIQRCEDPEDIEWELQADLGDWLPRWEDAITQQHYRVAFWFDS